VRIIKPKTIEAWASAHARAKSSLTNWVAVVQSARWSDFADLRQTFGSADQVKVASGRTVIVFNIAGNRFRLIAAVHYRTFIVFALRFLTHTDYDKNKWKDEL
jgi:mRNA interferase HigB